MLKALIDSKSKQYSNFIANTKKVPDGKSVIVRKNQGLFEHSLAVGCLAYAYAKNAKLSEDEAKEALKAGFLHDAGKILYLNSYFHTIVDKKPAKSYGLDDKNGDFVAEEQAAHAEVSWYAAVIYETIMGIRKKKDIGQLALRAIFYHHAVTMYKSPPGKGSKKHRGSRMSESSRCIQKRIGREGDEAVCQLIIPFIDSMTRIYCMLTKTNPKCQHGSPLLETEELDGTAEIPDFLAEEVPTFFIQSKYQNEEPDVEAFIATNSRNHLVRSCLVAADRHISSIEDDSALNSIIENISKCTEISEIPEAFATADLFSPASNDCSELSNFDDFCGRQITKSIGTRFEGITAYQTSLPKKCEGDTTTFLALSAGVGKTRLALNYAALSLSQKESRQIFWVVPRNAIAFALGKQIPAELESILGRDHSISVEVFLTGERQDGLGANLQKGHEIPPLGADIVVTNIDTILKVYHYHNVANKMLDFCQATMVFDEPHEFVSDNPMFFGFLTLMNARHSICQSRTIMLSATPLPFHRFWEDGKTSPTRIVTHKEVPHWNKKPIKLVYSQASELFSANESGFTVFGTVNNAIRHHCAEGTSLLLHGRFHDRDKKALIERALEVYGKNSTLPKEGISAALIVQAALDISAKKTIESLISPMKTIQTLGRTNRFGEHEYGELVCADLINSGEDASIYSQTAEKKIQEIIFDPELGAKWADKVKNFAEDNSETTIDELKDLYDSFFLENDIHVEEWLRRLAVRSLALCDNLPPLKKYRKTTRDRNGIRYASAGNMRQPTGSWYATAWVYKLPDSKTRTPTNLGRLLVGEDLMSLSEIELKQASRNLSGVYKGGPFKVLDRLNKEMRGVFHYQPSESDFLDWKKNSRSPLQPIPLLGNLKIQINDSDNIEGKKYLLNAEEGPGLGLVENKLLLELDILTPRERNGN